VRYCGDAVLTHLESVSRGRTGPDQIANGRLWCQTWQDRVTPDDLELYAADGLLSIRYEGDTTPLVAEVAVELATLERRERAREVERLLRQRTQQVHELLQDAVRLSVLAAGSGHPAALVRRAVPSQRTAPDGLELAELLESTHATVLDRDDRVQLALAELQAALAERLGDAFEPHPGPDYRRLVRQVRRSVESVAPAGSTVLVVSRGDDDLLQLDDRTGRHFPATPTAATPASTLRQRRSHPPPRGAAGLGSHAPGAAVDRPVVAGPLRRLRRAPPAAAASWSSTTPGTAASTACGNRHDEPVQLRLLYGAGPSAGHRRRSAADRAGAAEPAA
jgi:hypothetical protein